MPVSPSDLTGNVDGLVAEAEKKIDAYLKAHYVGEPCNITLPLTVNYAVQERLRTLYEAVGWLVEFRTFPGDRFEETDGGVTITLSPIKSGQKK